LQTWKGDEVLIQVYFDGGVVSRKQYEGMVPAVPGPIELICWRLKRLKERWLP
jgi:hypothetical protein